MSSAILNVQITERCNSNCVYCRLAGRQDKESMTLSTLEVLFARIAEYLEQGSDTAVELQLHGGEPLLAAEEFLDAVLANVQCVEHDHAGRLTLTMQSNLTCLTPELARLLTDLRIRDVGTSFDPEPGVRGPGRRPQTMGSTRKMLRALPLLERQGIRWGVIYVVTRKALERPVETYFLLSNLVGDRPLNLVPTIGFHERARQLAPSPDQYTAWLAAVARIWAVGRHRAPSVEPLRSHFDQVGRPAAGRDLATDCAVAGLRITVAPDGIVHPSRCGPAPGAPGLGGLRDQDLAGLIAANESRYREELVRKIETTECGDCPYWELCVGGTSQDAFSQNMLPGETGAWCRARRDFIENTIRPLREVETVEA